MTFVINLNKELIFGKLNECQYSFCSQLLKEEFKLIKNNDDKCIPKTPSELSLDILGLLLENLTSDIKNKEKQEDKLLLIQQCFQSLRNSAACGEKVQDSIIKNLKIMANTSTLLYFLTKKKTKSYSDCLKMLLQFLSNLIIQNPAAQAVVLKKFLDGFNVALFNPEVSHVVAIILYNILKNNTNLIEDDFDFVNNILTLLSLDVENLILVLELLVEKNVITKTYRELDSADKVSLLEYISVMQSQETIVIPIELVKLMCEEFKKQSDCILKTVIDYVDGIEPLEVAKLMDCLACASSNEKYLPEMQNDKSLLINCAYLLKSIHSAGKEGENDFTAIQKLSALKIEDPSVQLHPAFGFKASLIRILGNLCWKHEENQDLIRELECIPLIMDCCNIDARNPLIIQWAILTMRNLCENNDKNKALVAGMTKVGVVNSAIVREMGLTLNDDGTNKICIAPLNLKK